MKHSEFWAIVDAARSDAGSKAHTSTTLAQQLTTRSPEDILAFEGWLHTYFRALRREDLWCAVYLICGGCSDDSFDYFRGWLIGRGELAVRNALNDPESLGDLVGNADPRDDEMYSAARKAFEDTTRKKDRDRDRDRETRDLPTIPGRDAWPADRIEYGVEWTNDFMKARYPRLHARFEAPRLVKSPPKTSTPIAIDQDVVAAFTEQRFWAMIDDARKRRSPGDKSAMGVFIQLKQMLRALPVGEIVAFDAWLRAYDEALEARNDMRAASTIVLVPSSEHEEGASSLLIGFRGWLLTQGSHATLTALTKGLDHLASLDADLDPLESNRDLMYVAYTPLDEAGYYENRPPGERTPTPSIPNRETWTVDWSVDWANGKDAPEAARERLPRLAAMADARLERLPNYERDGVVRTLVARAKAAADDRSALAILTRALALGPTTDFVRVERGKFYLRLGDADAAMRDFDEAIAKDSLAHNALFERAKLLFSRGERDRAKEDAKRAETFGSRAATAWLSSLGRPKRVRHKKFGEGVVVAIEESGNDGDKLTIEFAKEIGRKQLLSKYVEVIE